LDSFRVDGALKAQAYCARAERQVFCGTNAVSVLYSGKAARFDLPQYSGSKFVIQ
jgi:hypothetical protein